MPPQIVGAGDGLSNFVIGDDDEENEHLNQYVQDVEPAGLPRRPLDGIMEPDIESERLASTLSKMRSPASGHVGNPSMLYFDQNSPIRDGPRGNFLGAGASLSIFDVPLGPLHRGIDGQGSNANISIFDVPMHRGIDGQGSNNGTTPPSNNLPG